MINRQALIGLLGVNIMKSLAPALHIDAFAAAGITGHYHLMDVDQLPGRTLQNLLAAVKTGDKAAIQTAFGDMGKNGCGACHGKFREEIKQ